MPRSTRIAFIEMAATKDTEMKRLATMARPQAALVTNFYRKKLGTQETKEPIAKEICSLLESLPQDGFAIIEKDPKVDTSAVTCALKYWNEETKGNPMLRAIGTAGHNTMHLCCRFADATEAAFTINASHAFVKEMCALAIQAAYHLGVPPSTIVERLKNYHLETMRTEVWKNKSGPTFVNGTYCHTTLSFEASLDELAAYAQSTSSTQSGKTILVFGGLKDGENSPTSAKRLIDSMASHGITEVYAWPTAVAESLQRVGSERLSIYGEASLEEAVATAKRRSAPSTRSSSKVQRKSPLTGSSSKSKRALLTLWHASTLPPSGPISN